MGQIVKRFADGSFLEYDRGSFDDFCVYLTNADGRRNPPRDTDYFASLQSLAMKYGVDKVYNDYVKVYDNTGKTVDENTFGLISEIAASYGKDSIEVETIFCILHMAMVAEERKKYTKLGKRIKRVGIHVLLKEGKDVRTAANFMRGMGWRDIDALCRARGF